MNNAKDETLVHVNIEAVWNRINNAAERSGRVADNISLIAVSKTKPVEVINQALQSGQLHFGENRVQELVSKMDVFGPDLMWHMIGTLQSNKIKYMAHRVNWIHSVPKLKTLEEIDKRAGEHQRTINVLIQVNISDEDQKSGCDASDLPAILEKAQDLKHVRVAGLMGMASFEKDPELVRPQFRMLRELRDTLASSYGGSVELRELSMGMTHDLEVAVEEGATMVRVGSAIFGDR